MQVVLDKWFPLSALGGPCGRGFTGSGAGFFGGGGGGAGGAYDILILC